MFHQAAIIDDLLHKGRDRIGLKSLTCCLILDLPFLQIHCKFMAILDSINRFIAFYDGQAQIEGISIEYSGKGLGNDT